MAGDAQGMTHTSISLRPVEPSDEAFLLEVYASTRQEELKAFGWPEAVLWSFLRMQFEARRRSYVVQWPTAESSVVLVGQTPAGTILVWRGEGEVRVVDIALLPAYRGQGFGARLLMQLAGTATGPLRLSVARGNRAQSLYERLGFRVVREDPMYLEMERPT